MKAKKILSFLIVFTMILSSVGITGFASETSVADGFGIEEDGNVVESASAVQDFIITMYYEIGITATYTYEVGTEATLAGCIDDVFDDNFDGGLLGSIASIEIDINADMEITEPIVIPTGKTAVLDLNGHTMTYNSTTQGEAMITNKGTLTINDSSDPDTGVIYYNYTGVADSTYGKGNYTISNGGTLTVNGGKITIADLRAHAKYPIDNNSTTGDAILVINGGHLYNYNTSAIRQFCNSTTNKNSVTINGGLIEGYCAIWVQNPGSKTVNGSLSITNGEIKSTAAAYVNGTSELKDVSSEIYFSIDGEGGAWSEDSAVSITGGTINENVYLAEEAPAAITVDKTNAKFNGKVEIPAPATPVAAIGDITFTSLHEALTIAKAGETVELISDVDLSGTEWEPVSFKGKFNGNGYKIKNLTINKPDISYVGFITSLNSVFENVTFENATVTGGENTGVVAGTAGGHAALTKDITVTGIIKVETTHSGYARAGMIVGGWAYGNYENITVDGIDKAQSYIKHTGGGDGRYVAGIVGHADDVTSYKNCTVKNITISGGWLCGGISGPGPADGLATGCTVENVDVDADYSGGMFGWYYGNGTIEDSTVKEVTFVGGSTNNGAIGGYSNNTEAIINNVTIENVKNADGKPLLSDVAAVTSKGNKTVVYSSLEEAFTAALDGETITLLADATPTLTSQRAITKASVIDLGGKTLTLTEDDLYFGTTTFKNGTIVVDPSVKPSTAVFWMFKDQTLTFDNVKVIATGVTGTYLIGLDGNNSDLNLINGTEIVVENETALDLDIICVNSSTGNDILVENSKVNVKNLDGRVFFRGNYTVSGASEIYLDGITKAGFRIEANQTLTIADTSSVTITGEPRDGGIHLTDESAVYEKADTATVNATVNIPAVFVASIGDAKFTALADAANAAKSGDTITMLEDATLTETVTLPAGIIFNGNGKTITGNIVAGGDLTFEGYTKVTSFNAGYNKPTITIGESATLETTSGRMVIGHGATFNITGSVADAKTADATSIIPSLIAPGASFTGAGVNFNVTNAYIKFSDYCSSKNSNASNTFNIKVTNSIWEQANKIQFSEPTNGMDPTFNFTVKDSVLNSTSHLVFAVTKGEIVIDNSLVNNGAYKQLENRSNLTIKNGSVVYASVQTSQNAKNPGTTTVDNATYVTTGTFGGADIGTGTLILQNNAKVTTGTLAKVNVTVDGTSLLTATNVGDTTTVTVDGSALEVGNTVKVIDLSGKASVEDIVTVKGDGVVATYGEDGDITITKQEVVVETPYGTLTNAYTSETGYWGECGGNAKESFEFKFYNNDTYMGYTKLNNIGGIINGNVYVSWNIMLDAESNTDEYWDMAWEIAPTIDMQANRVEQWVDGVKVAECAIEPNWSDSIFPVVAAVTDENGKILSYVNNHLHATLENAIANGGNVVLLKDISLTNMITVPANTSVTLDLNGKTITGTDTTSKNFSIIDNRGELTVTGNGKMTLTATIDSDWNRYSAVIANNPGGKLVIENGTIEHLGGTDMAYGIDNLTNGKGTYAETIVNGGTVKSTYRGIRQFLNGVEAQNILTINGGTVEGANKSVFFHDPSTKANTGKLTVSENATLNGDVYLFVTEGSTEWPVEVNIAASAVNGEVISANVPEGYEIVKENGCYGVVEKTVVTESPFKDAPLFLAGIDNEVVDGITYHPVYIATSIDSLNYQKVGFDYIFTIFDPETNEVTFTAPYTTETTDVYESISDSTTTYTVESIGGNGSYLFMNKLWFDAEYYNNDNTKITITPYAYDMNGNKITGWTIDMTNEYYKSLQTGNVKQDMFKEVK